MYKYNIPSRDKNQYLSVKKMVLSSLLATQGIIADLAARLESAARNDDLKKTSG